MASASAAPALAAVRYAAPGSSDVSGLCETVATACRIDHAVNDATFPAEVIVEAGSYSATPTLNVQTGVSVHGDDAQAVPVVTGNHPMGTLVAVGNGASVRRLMLNELAANGRGVNAVSSNATLDGLQVTAGDIGVFVLGSGNKLLNSVVQSQGKEAVRVQTGTNDLRNVTAIAPSDAAVWAYSSAGSEVLNVKNVIARGTAGQDLKTSLGGGTGSTLNVSYSNYKTTNTAGGGSVVDQGNNQTSVDPLFVNAGAGNYREAAGSPTIDKGTPDTLNGPSDPDGLPRSLGTAPDIGAFEFAPPPTVTTGAASAITTTGATLAAAINPNGTATTDGFDVGTAPGVYTQPVSAPTAGSGTTAATVSAALTGLSPNTTYYYRARATNPSGTTLGTEQSFTTPATPPATPPPPGCPPNCPPPVRPVVTGLSQSAPKWRENNKLGQISKKKPPVGTTFGFSLNEPAAVRLNFTRPAAGRKVSRKCVPASRKNRKKPKCTRTVIVGTLAFHAHAGANRVRFAGRLSATKKLKPGRYTLTITATSAGLRSKPRSLSFTIVKG